MKNTSESPDLRCVECGTLLIYEGVGRRPRYCSQTCRSRAWEKRRAARAGLIAQEVVERRVEVPQPLNAEHIAQWLSGRPRRISKVLKLMEWTDEHREAFRHGLEHSGEGLSLISAADKTRLYTASQETFYLKRKLDHHNQQLRTQQQENTALRQELQRYKNAGNPLPAARVGHLPGFASTPAPSGDTKTVTVGGKQFTVPADWTRQQIRQWSRNHPEKGH